MEQVNELLTLRDFLRFCLTQFNQANLYYGHGTDNAWDESIALVAHALNLGQTLRHELLDARLLKDERTKLLDLIKQRITSKKPLPYLIQEAWFAGLPFYVDERVLIPRSPIAELIEQQFEPWIDPLNVQHVLDMCTGSACIAIACAKAFPEAKVDAVDISKSALEVAEINVRKHAVSEQVSLIESDLWQHIPNIKYDIIVSNPPYVTTKEMSELPTEYHHEPTLALAAGSDGLDIVLKILKSAVDYLSENGILIVEVGNSEYFLTEKYPDIDFTWLEFERGGGGIFLLTAAQLRQIVW